MKRTLIFLLAVGTVMAQDLIRGSYSYTYGDSESLVEARKTCKDLAVRDAIESYYLFVESSTEVENSTLKEDIINTLSAGYLSNLNVVDQTVEGRTLTCTVEANVDPEAVQALVQKKVESASETAGTPGATAQQQAPAANTESLETVLLRYEKRMMQTEGDWTQGNYSAALNQVQDLQKELESVAHKGATPFQKNLYLCVHKRTVLIKHLLRLHQAEQEAARRLYVRSEIKQVAQDAVQLKDAMNKLSSINAETERQQKIKDFWLNRCQDTLDRAKNAARVRRR
jgi:hypothetical protein